MTISPVGRAADRRDYSASARNGHHCVPWRASREHGSPGNAGFQPASGPARVPVFRQPGCPRPGGRVLPERTGGATRSFGVRRKPVGGWHWPSRKRSCGRRRAPARRHVRGRLDRHAGRGIPPCGTRSGAGPSASPRNPARRSPPRAPLRPDTARGTAAPRSRRKGAGRSDPAAAGRSAPGTRVRRGRRATGRTADG